MAGSHSLSNILPARMRALCNPEMCTNAFLKMHEMLCAYELVPKSLKVGRQQCHAPFG